jgi:Domain of unknown function (DUF1851)
VDLQALLAAFPADAPLRPRLRSTTGTVPSEVSVIVSELGGVSLAGGLYRVLSPPDVLRWTATAHVGFLEFRDRATVFGADWLGRMFAVDTARLNTRGVPQVLTLEPGTGTALELPVSVEELHEAELIEAPDAALAAGFYDAWRTENGDAVALGQEECVGYRVPLFLGGSDDLSNLQRCDMEVYWTLVGQMRSQASSVPSGTTIASLTVDEPKRGLFRRR